MKELLQPIAGGTPVGEDLTFSTEFDAITETRRHDDPSLAQGEWTRDLKTADWGSALRQCEKLLKERTKDLRLAGWYAEARTQLHGFAGLADGYALTTAFCRDFWESIHPAGDEEERAGSLRWLAVQSAGWVRRLPLGNEHTLDDLKASQGSRAEDVAERRAHWRASVSVQRREVLANEARSALSALDALDTRMQSRLGDETPSLSAARSALSDAINVLRLEHITSGAAPATKVPADPTFPSPPSEAMPAATGGGSNAFRTRADALQALREVASFFRDTEPHSPVAYLADKAARWGDMPLHTWLRTVLGDGEAFGRLSDLLDIAERPDPR
jgi:type VI secretion system protein ImpA